MEAKIDARIVRNANTRYLMSSDKIDELEAIIDSTADPELKAKCKEAVRAIYHAVHLCLEADSMVEHTLAH